MIGLVARVGSQPMGLATVQEMRSAILSFRSKNKPVVVYSETFGEFGPGNNAYYLATAFDEIYLQPSGDLEMTIFGQAPSPSPRPITLILFVMLICHATYSLTERL